MARTPTVEPSVGAMIDRPVDGGPAGVLVQPETPGQARPAATSHIACLLRRFIDNSSAPGIPSERGGISAGCRPSPTAGAVGWTEVGGACDGATHSCNGSADGP